MESVCFPWEVLCESLKKVSSTVWLKELDESSKDDTKYHLSQIKKRLDEVIKDPRFVGSELYDGTYKLVSELQNACQ